MLLNVSNNYLYTETDILPISEFHSPYFMVLGGDRERRTLQDILRSGGIESGAGNEVPQGTLGHIQRLGEPETYQSFSRPGKEQEVFKVFLDESRYVPEVSDHLFFRHGFFTAEHDIPYVHRAASDLAAQGKWILDSEGKDTTLRVLCYDIETPSYQKNQEKAPVEIIGFTEFDVTFNSRHDLDREEFHFDLQEISGDWKEDVVWQFEARGGGQDEVKTVLEFVKHAKRSHIISGHNILSFDNHHLYNRIKSFIDGTEGILSEDERRLLIDFKERFCRPENFFTYGKKSLGVNFHPISLDTYHGALRFYRFLPAFDLKSLAQFLGVRIDNREYIDKNEMDGVDWNRLMTYSNHDVQEQAGITRIMLQQALPLAFSTGMPLEALLSSGATKVWDYMTMIRGARHKKIIPATCRAHGVSAGILRILKERGIEDPNLVDVKKEFVHGMRDTWDTLHSHSLSAQTGPDDGQEGPLDKELIRVVKYGPEMPDWVNYPYLAFNSRRMDDKSGDIGYHLPGGMTIQPTDVNSDFVPWWHVIMADVGAMYPTILKGMNIGADTVGLAKKGEEPDDWVWLKHITEDFRERDDVLIRHISEMPGEKYADKGYFIGVKLHSAEGMVNLAMTGILSLIFKIKDDIKARAGAGEDTRNLKMMYNSLKGMRNAGTHGILVASNVSCRQFNLWGGAEITTTGQRILQDAMDEFEQRNMRVVYGDTDGIYVACSRSCLGLPEVCRAFDVPSGKGEYFSDPDEVLKVIQLLNDRWQKKLDYPGFELESEYADIMLFVKHKNYLIWNARNGELSMTTKGNNFKGSDKAPIAQKVLGEIMFRVLKEHQVWTDEQKARDSIKRSIKRHTIDIVERLDLSEVALEDLVMIQSVRPASYYKERGGSSVHAERSKALGKLLDRNITTSGKFKFVVTKMPLPGINDPSKSGIKPIDYMYPVEMVTDLSNIDLDWYRDMIMNYVKGAFGLQELEKTVQRGLHEFM